MGERMVLGGCAVPEADVPRQGQLPLVQMLVRRPTGRLCSPVAIAVLSLSASNGLAACAGAPSSQPPSETAAAPRATEQALDSEDECFTGGPPDVLQARVAMRERKSGEIVSVVDVEADGPRRDAFRACHGLVARELELDGVSGGALEAKVVRPCSTDALPVAKLTAGAMLVDRRTSNALTMLGIESLGGVERFACEPQALEKVQVATRRLAAYPDEAACEHSRERLEQAMAMAQSRAAVAALEWLQHQVTTQRTQIEQTCAKAPKSASCAEQRRLLELLEDKRRELAAQPAERPSDVSLTCHVAP